MRRRMVIYPLNSRSQPVARRQSQYNWTTDPARFRRCDDVDVWNEEDLSSKRIDLLDSSDTDSRRSASSIAAQTQRKPSRLALRVQQLSGLLSDEAGLEGKRAV